MTWDWKGFNACEKYKASWLPPKIETNVQDKGRLGGPVFGVAFVLSRGCASLLSAFNYLVSPISICPFPFVHSLFVGLMHTITPPSPNADKCGGIENSCDPWNLTRVMTWWPDRLNDPSPQSTKEPRVETMNPQPPQSTGPFRVTQEAFDPWDLWMWTLVKIMFLSIKWQLRPTSPAGLACQWIQTPRRVKTDFRRKTGPCLAVFELIRNIPTGKTTLGAVCLRLCQFWMQS